MVAFEADAPAHQWAVAVAIHHVLAFHLVERGHDAAVHEAGDAPRLRREPDAAARIGALIEPGPGGERVATTVPGADGATQREVYDDVLAAARAADGRPRVLVIAGDAGVGKSTVLRLVARRLAAALTAGAPGDAPLPLLIPLYFATLPAARLAALELDGTPERRGRALLDVLLDWWCGWINDTTTPTRSAPTGCAPACAPSRPR